MVYVKTWEDVVDMLDIDINKFNKLCVNLTEGEIAERKLLLIIKVLNEDWIPKYNETLYTIYWNRNKDGSFSYYFYDHWHPYSNVGYGSGFKNGKLAKYCAEQFIDLWNIYLKYNTNNLLQLIQNAE